MPVVTDLFVYPIKSCGGIRLGTADLWETGLYLDRLWMLIDAQGAMVTQRTAPRLALVSTALKFESLQVRAPGMLRLDIPVGGFDYEAAERIETDVWGSRVETLAESTLVDTWFSRFLDRPVRLMRIDPDFRRVCDPAWTGAHEAITQLADGFPLLVISQASLADLNRRMTAAGKPALPMDRFRPNLVVDGLDPYGEDHLATLSHPDYEIRLVKRCARCAVPCVDQQTGQTGTEPTDTLASYRFDEKSGGVAFGMNAIIVRGADEAVVRVGDELRAEIAFD